MSNRQSRQMSGTLAGVNSYTGDQFDGRDLLDSGSGYTYDANGNTLTSAANGAQCVYDAENHLVQQTAGGTTVILVYDDDGNRVSKTVGGTTTYYLVEE